jgi:hypothetical protein
MMKPEGQRARDQIIRAAFTTIELKLAKSRKQLPTCVIMSLITLSPDTGCSTKSLYYSN